MTEILNVREIGPEEDLDETGTRGTGLEPEEVGGSDVIVEPFNPGLIRVETRTMTIDLLMRRIREGDIDMAPDFQRKAGIWKDSAKSRLIESILIRIPLPAFYMDASDDDKWLVVDGLQRLTALRQFIVDNRLRLTSLEFLTVLEHKTFGELPRNYQRRIEETQVTVYLIQQGTPPQVKFNIFKRINTGGLPLSSQEIRHALNQGKVTRLLEELAESKDFKTATNNGIRDDRMGDRECVMRFLAFAITPYTDYKQDFDDFLNTRMHLINQMADDEVADLARRFRRAMAMAYRLFGRDAFRKRLNLNDTRYPINKALLEAWSVNLDKLTDDQIALLERRSTDLINGFIRIMNTSAFNDAVSQGTGDVNKVKRRFGDIERLLQEVLQ